MTQTMSLSYKQWHAGLFSKDNEQRGFWEPVALYKFEGVMEYGMRHFGAMSVSSVVLKGKCISSQSMMSKNWKYEISFFP